MLMSGVLYIGKAPQEDAEAQRALNKMGVRYRLCNVVRTKRDHVRTPLFVCGAVECVGAKNIASYALRRRLDKAEAFSYNQGA